MCLLSLTISHRNILYWLALIHKYLLYVRISTFWQMWKSEANEKHWISFGFESIVLLLITPAALSIKNPPLKNTIKLLFGLVFPLCTFCTLVASRNFTDMATSEGPLTACCCFENYFLRSVPLQLDCHSYVLNFYVITENKSWSFEPIIFSSSYTGSQFIFYLNLNYLNLNLNWLLPSCLYSVILHQQAGKFT